MNPVFPVWTLALGGKITCGLFCIPSLFSRAAIPFWRLYVSALTDVGFREDASRPETLGLEAATQGLWVP